MGDLHYYELCFYHDEDDDLATQGRCSYCIKTEIPPVIPEDVALKILFGDTPKEHEKTLMKNLTCIMEISEAEAISEFDMDGLIKRTEKDFGVYYVRGK